MTQQLHFQAHTAAWKPETGTEACTLVLTETLHTVAEATQVPVMGE